MTNPVLRALRPQPHRGDQVAAGVVVLATLVLLLDVRFADAWGSGARLAVAAVAAAFVGVLAALSPVEADSPRAYQTVLYVTTCLLTLLALVELAGVLGADATNAGPVTWIALLTGVLALVFAKRRDSAYCTLVAALAFTAVLQGVVELVFDGSEGTGVRWVFLVVLLGELYGVALLRDRQRRHAVMLIAAAGLAALGIAMTYAGIQAVGGGAPAWGWMLVVLAVGFALVAYAGVDREPGPGYLGVAILVVFALLAGQNGDATLLGWPLLLAVIAGVFLVLGLRPSVPLPPAPAGDEPVEPRAVPLPRREAEEPPAVRPRPRGEDEL